jgi:hypothetical protein
MMGGCRFVLETAAVTPQSPVFCFPLLKGSCPICLFSFAQGVQRGSRIAPALLLNAHRRLVLEASPNKIPHVLRRLVVAAAERAQPERVIDLS